MSRRLLALVLLTCALSAATTLPSLPVLAGPAAQPAAADWLISRVGRKSAAYRSQSGKELILTNGLILRAWRLAPDAATVSFINLRTGQSLLRGVKPECIIEVDGVTWNVGGLDGQPDYAYLKPEWLDRMTAHAHAFHFTGFDIGQTRAPFPWKPVPASGAAAWPPPGVSLTLHFAALPGVEVLVHYEMYDSLPLMSKWIEIRNASAAAVTLNHITAELLAVVDYESTVDHPPLPPDVLHVETD